MKAMARPTGGGSGRDPDGVSRHLIVPLLILLVGLVYAQVARHAFIVIDDHLYVTANAPVRAGLTPEGLLWAFTTLHAFNWHPLTWLSHMLDVELYGMRAGGHHLTSAVIHALSSVLLYLVLRRATGASWRSGAVAALFAIHPLHVESVAWVAERKDVLGGLFWMLTLGAYLRYTERPGVSRYLAVFLCLALGLMAKPMLVTLPFVLLLLDYWPLGRLGGDASRGEPGTDRPAWRNVLLEKVPLLALSAVSSVVTLFAQRQGGNVTAEPYPLAVRAGNAVVSFGTYLVNAVFPFSLSVFYPHPGSAIPAWKVFSSAVALILVTAVVLRERRRRPWLAVGWFWYLGTLVPVIGLVQVGRQAMADRYTYIPLVGVFLAVVWGIAEEARRRSPRVREMAAVAGAAILIFLTVVAREQAGYWRDGETLLRHAIEGTDGNWAAHNLLGAELGRQGRTAEALECFREAIRVNPGYADARFNLGVALDETGDAEGAMREYRATIALRPEHARARINLGGLLNQAGRLDEAAVQFREALRIHPGSAEAYNNLGTVYARQGRLVEAIAAFERALALRPAYAEAHVNIGLAMVSRGRTEEAIPHFREAVRLRPGDDNALGHLERALRGKRG